MILDISKEYKRFISERGIQTPTEDELMEFLSIIEDKIRQGCEEVFPKKYSVLVKTELIDLSH